MRKNKPEAIIVHHEGADNGLFTVQQWHKEGRGFPRSSLGWNIGYQWYIDRDGNETQTRSETEEGMHTLGGWNLKSIGICLEGNLNAHIPSQGQLLTLEKLMDRIQVKYDIPNTKLFGHEELWPKACPGKYLMDWLRMYRKYDITYYQIKVNQLRGIIAELRLRLKLKNV